MRIRFFLINRDIVNTGCQNNFWLNAEHYAGQLVLLLLLHGSGFFNNRAEKDNRIYG